MKLIVAIHGILTSQTSLDWPDALDAWCALHAPDVKVLKKEYRAGPLPLWNTHWTNPRLARGLAAEIEAFADEFGAALEIHFVAHSNGTDVALQTIKALAARDIDTRTFIALGSILPADIARNGIARLMANEHLDRAVAYVSADDEAVHAAAFSIGYGSLGRTGWIVKGEQIPDIHPDAERTDYRFEHGELITRRFVGYGHGDYFAPTHREETFVRLLRDCGLPFSPFTLRPASPEEIAAARAATRNQS